MKKIVSLVLLAASLQSLAPSESQAGIILSAIGASGSALDVVGGAAVVGGLVSGSIGYAIGCDKSVTHYRREPVYGTDRWGRRRIIGYRRVETTECVVWNGNPTASTLMWTALGLIVLDAEVSQDKDALDSTLRSTFPFIDDFETIEALGNLARDKAAPIFADGKDTAIVSLTEAEVLPSLSRSALTKTQIQIVVDALK